MRRPNHLQSYLIAGGLLLAPPLCAQAPPTAVFQGIVVDSASGEPLPGVLVRMDTGSQTLSDAEGSFHLEDLDPGRHLYAVLTAGCRITWRQVVLESGEKREAVVKLPAAEAAARAEEAEARRRRAQGKVVTAREIQAMGETSLAEVIRRVAPNMVGSPGGQFGQSTQVRGRTQNSLTTPEPEPVVVVDGMRIEDASTALDLIRPSDVETLEVLPGAAAGWQFGSSGAAGVIRLTTIRGGDRASPPGVEGCTVPDFPRGRGSRP